MSCIPWGPMITTRAVRAIALLAGSTLMLGACAMPSLSRLGGGPDLAATDVITLTHPQTMPDGYYGETTIEIGEHTLTERYVLPDGTEIYSVEQELSAEDRDHLEQATETYLDSEPSVPADERIDCMDAGLQTVEVSGSITHASSMQDCDPGIPLARAQRPGPRLPGRESRTARSARRRLDGRVPPLGRGRSGRIRPGRDLRAGRRRLRRGHVHHRRQRPGRLGRIPHRAGGPLRDHRHRTLLAPWSLIGPVLADLNTLLLEHDPSTCEDPSGRGARSLRGHPGADLDLSSCAPASRPRPSSRSCAGCDPVRTLGAGAAART